MEMVDVNHIINLMEKKPYGKSSYNKPYNNKSYNRNNSYRNQSNFGSDDNADKTED